MKAMSIQSFPPSEYPLDDAIPTSRKKLKFLTVRIPVFCQIVIVILSHVNGGFNRCRHKQSPDQHVGLQRFDPNWWCGFCEIQLFLQILEDFLKVPIIGCLHIVEVQLRPFRTGCPLLARSISWCGLSLMIHLSAPVSRCWKIEHHFVSSLESTLLGLGWCRATVFCCELKRHSDAILDSPGCSKYSNRMEDLSSHSGSSMIPNS